MTKSLRAIRRHAEEPPLMSVVSSRIRARREERRLSLDRLAELSQVSKGLLVHIESGRANPSIATLCKVAAALGASVADLVQVSGAQAAEVLPAGAPRLLWRGPKGGSATLLVGATGPDMLELWSWTLQPGERYDAPAHPEGTQELIHVEQGSLALAFGDVRYVIAAGGSAIAHTDRPHAYAAEGRRPVRFTMVVAEWHSPPPPRRRTRRGAGA
ncbi:MAG TPA: XRE family transcriptional regulator [Vicinamibacterales bacterium]|nr:XRE family transcriptional regulator [Vicinamibacterales bacterium]